MKVLMLDAPPAMLAERRRLGQDERDEMWDGVLHMVPPPGGPNQRLGSMFFRVAAPVAERVGLEPWYETGLFRSSRDYRVPDLAFARPEQMSDRGLEGAELVVEIRSARDESYEKLDFYARIGVQEVLVLHPDPRRVELFWAAGTGMAPAQPGLDGELVSRVLGITLKVVGDKIRITWAGGEAGI